MPMRRTFLWSLCLLVGAAACGDEKQPPAPGPVTSAGPASGAPVGSATAQAGTDQPRAGGTGAPDVSASTAPAAAPEPEDEKNDLPKPRALRTGERAQVERSFPATALFDMRQSFQIELADQGNCSFVSETVRAGKAPDAEPQTDAPEPADGPAPSPSASATAAASASATAAPADVAPDVQNPKPPEIAGFKFHLLCREAGKKEVKQTELPGYPQLKPTWKPDKIVAISFPDLDGDGKHEIIAITTYKDGGKGDAIPIILVYTQKSGAYILERKWTETATKAKADTVAKVKFALDIKKP